MKARLFNVFGDLRHHLPGRMGLLVSLSRYVQNPWTRDSQVRANIVGIAPRVSGPIIHVAVHDNQQMKMGDMLFEIDPTDLRCSA